MKYGNIPDEVLNLIVSHDLIDKQGNWINLSLKDELDEVGEDILNADWLLTDDNKIVHFTAWTENCVMTLIDDYLSLGDKQMLVLQRNP